MNEDDLDYRLPDRRMQITHAATWAKKVWIFSVGFDADGRAREIFLKGPKTGSDMEAIVEDACVWASKLLQCGVPAKELARCVGREGIERDAPSASVLGLAAKWAARTEKRTGGTIRLAHQAAAGRLTGDPSDNEIEMVAAFLKDRTEVRRGEATDMATLYSAYQDWTDGTNDPAIDPYLFGLSLSALGAQQSQTAGRKEPVVFQNVRLIGAA